ncbi:GNAT family N-acetyltransferase [Pelagibacterium sp.]|uniref:GNAT family N-acetyltransferase n=1 Tax=Pelagibacterium sp. TaxID=1967288 RepID=UPI003A8E01CB
MSVDFRFEPASLGDFDRLADLRLTVMRDSLDAVGRFDPERNRLYFEARFRPQFTRLIVIEKSLAGCVALGPCDDRLVLEHFYLTPEWQGAGLGSAVLQRLLKEADAAQKIVRLTVLRGSDARRFYDRYGFAQVGEDDVDIFLERAVAAS